MLWNFPRFSAHVWDQKGQQFLLVSSFNFNFELSLNPNHFKYSLSSVITSKTALFWFLDLSFLWSFSLWRVQEIIESSRKEGVKMLCSGKVSSKFEVSRDLTRQTFFPSLLYSPPICETFSGIKGDKIITAKFKSCKILIKAF